MVESERKNALVMAKEARSLAGSTQTACRAMAKPDHAMLTLAAAIVKLSTVVELLVEDRR